MDIRKKRNIICKRKPNTVLVLRKFWELKRVKVSK